jgi:hypothetical protein
MADERYLISAARYVKSDKALQAVTDIAALLNKVYFRSRSPSGGAWS